MIKPSNSLSRECWQGMVRMLIVHGILVVHNLLELFLVAPTFVHMFDGLFVELPGPTGFLAKTLFVFQRCGLLLLPLCLLALYIDAKVYVLLYIYRSKQLAGVWFWTIAGLLVAWSLFAVLTMYLPVWKMTQVVGG